RGPCGAATVTAQVCKVHYSSSTAPKVTTSPADKLVAVGQDAIFSVAVTGSSPFTYQWQRNDVDIQDATGATYTVPAASASDDGAKYRVIVTNSFGTATS